MSEIHVAILKKAREYIGNNSFGYICNAVQYAVGSGEAGYSRHVAKYAVEDILTIIHAGIAPYDTLTSWMCEEGLQHDGYTMAQARLAWLDKMIKYWEKQP